MNIQKKKLGNSTALLFIEILILIAVFTTLVMSFINIDSEATAQGAKQLETSVRRAAVACYASEGVYPPTIDYLVDNYGLQIDRSRYSVHYSVFAENMMPDITVVLK